jgi:hypothetical protein
MHIRCDTCDETVTAEWETLEEALASLIQMEIDFLQNSTILARANKHEHHEVFAVGFPEHLPEVL